MKEDPMTSETPKTTRARISRTRKAAASRAGPVDAVKDSARDAYRTVETMPKSQQKTLTRASLGIGAALFILGAPRILTLLALLPALAVAGMKVAKRHA
jgi:hypothetical protein